VKTPIDRIRDSAVSMTLAGAGGAITEMMAIGDVLHIVTEGSIHEIKLADKIDPQRTNPNVPNAQMKVLDLGSGSPLVGKTLLTAKNLFQSKFLRAGIDLEDAVAGTFKALKELAAMDAIVRQLHEDQDRATANPDVRLVRADRSVAVPQVGEVERRCKEFVQKADHTSQALFRICELFFGPIKKKWFEGLLEEVLCRYGDEADFVVFLGQVLPFLQFVRSVRNAIEHPAQYQRVEVRDFHIVSAPGILPPSVTVILPGSAPATVALEDFFSQILNQLVDLFERTLGYLAEISLNQNEGGFTFALLDLPVDRRLSPHVRYGFGVMINGEMQPIG